MNRTLSMALLITHCAIGIGCACDSAADNSGTPPPQGSHNMQQLTGTLKSGYMGIGGEHTGWVLIVPAAKGESQEKQVEVDVSHVRATAKVTDGRRVTISGSSIEKKYVERGPTMIFVINSIEECH